MPTLTKRNRITPLLVKPSKGWNTEAAEANLSPEYALILDNVMIDKNGRITKRNGSISIATIPDNAVIRGFGEYIAADGTKQVIFNTSDGKLYRLNSGNTLTEIAGNYTQNTRCYFENFGGTTVISNGVMQPKGYDGTSSTALSSDANLPNFKFGVVHNNRFHVAGVSGSRTTWTASKAGSVTASDAWTVPSTIVATSPFSTNISRYIGKGEEIVTLGVYLKKLLIVCREHVVLFDTPTDATLLDMEADFPVPGGISPAGGVNYGNDFAFWSKFGITTIASSVRSQKLEPGANISRNINSHLQSRFQFIIDNGLEDYVTFVNYPQRRLIGVNLPTDVAASKFEQIWYHYFFDAWFRWTGINTPSLFVASDGTLYGSTPGKLLQLDAGTNDDGAKIDTVYKTPPLYLGDGTRNKRLTWITYVVDNGIKQIDFDELLTWNLGSTTADLTYKSFSVPPTGSLWNRAKWNKAQWSGKGKSFFRRKVRGRGVAVQLLLRNNAKDQPFTLEYIRFENILGGITRS